MASMKPPRDQPPPKPPSKICDSCGEAIPVEAIVCRQCRNYQGKWWWWRLAGVSTPWLIVLGTIASFFVTRITESAHTPENDLSISIRRVNAQGGELLVYNSHSSPAVITGPNLIYCRMPGPSGYSYLNGVKQQSGDTIISPNAALQVGLDFVPLKFPYEGVAKNWKEPDLKEFLDQHPEATCDISIVFESGGKEFAKRVVLSDANKGQAE